MNKRDKKQWWARFRVLASWLSGILLAVLLLQADRPDKTKTVWDVLYEFLTKFIVAAAGFVTAAVGGWQEITKALVYVMAFDYVTGITVACFGKSKKTESGKLSSAAGFKGLLKKGLILGVVALANFVDTGSGAGGHDVRNLVCWCYMANEGLSIVENLEALSIWIPAPLRKLLEMMREKGQGPKLPAEEEKTKGSGVG